MARLTKEDHARILLMVESEQQPVRDVAASFDVSPSTIYSVLSRLRQAREEAAPIAAAPRAAAPIAAASSAAAPTVSAPIAAARPKLTLSLGRGAVSGKEDRTEAPANTAPPRAAALPRPAAAAASGKALESAAGTGKRKRPPRPAHLRRAARIAALEAMLVEGEE